MKSTVLSIILLFLTSLATAQDLSGLGNLISKLLCFAFMIIPAVMTISIIIGGIIVLTGDSARRKQGKGWVINAVIGYIILIIVAWLVSLTTAEIELIEFIQCSGGGPAPRFSPDNGTIQLNIPPTADARVGLSTNPQDKSASSNNPNTVFYFSGSLSTDLDGDIIEYYWDFGDGHSTTGELVSHIYGSYGVYHVRLRVMDDNFAYHTDEVIVYIGSHITSTTGPGTTTTGTGTTTTGPGTTTTGPETTTTGTGTTTSSQTTTTTTSTSTTSIVGVCPVPPTFDLRGQMSPIRYQGICGSCWAFATVGAVEGDYGGSIDLSEQDLISCSAGSCSGGSAFLALSRIKNTGIVDEGCFSYQDTFGCPVSCSGCSAMPAVCSNALCSGRCSAWNTKLWRITDWDHIPSDRCEIQKALVNEGPLVVSASPSNDFKAYSGGVHTCTGSDFSHAMVIVGYDDPGGYWIVRNSWSTSWGESGYCRIAYGSCGIENVVYSIDNVIPPP